MNSVISIMVPIYDVENYLSQCIESLIHQTYNNIEIILVDDGATDASGQICDDYARQDHRIKVIHKDNGGLVSARKAALQCATGEYATFVDGDDWIDLEMCEILLKEMEDNQIDIITFATYKEYGDKSSFFADEIPQGIYDNESADLCEKLFFCGSAQANGIIPNWSKMYKTSLLKRFYLCLDERMSLGEDAACTYSCIPFADRVQVMHQAFYHYRFRSDSIVHKKNPRALEQIELVHNHLIQQLQHNKHYDVLKKQIDVYTTINIFRAINYFMEFSDTTKIPLYILPSKIYQYGKRIILYGAGMVGQSYEQQIVCAEDLSLVLWVDRMAVHYRNQGKSVDDISQIIKHDYDVILIAALDKDMAGEIKKTLLGMGVMENKIYWEKPTSLVDNYIKL